jgi:hypothetical protein
LKRGLLRYIIRFPIVTTLLFVNPLWATKVRNRLLV